MRLLSTLFSWRKHRRQLDEEIEFHLEMQARENSRRGMAEEQARIAARRSFGGIEQTREVYREQAGLAPLDTILQDLRYGGRQLSRNRGFTAVAILTLALGIGALTSVFSVVKAVLLDPLPFAGANRMVMLWQSAPQFGLDRYSLSEFNFSYYRDHTSAFEKAVGYDTGTATLTGGGKAERVPTAIVSYNFFDMLGARPVLGRAFLSQENQPGRHDATVLSYRLWQRRFGGSQDVLGKTVAVDGEQLTIVGVAPAWFQFPQDVELWGPAKIDPTRTNAYHMRCLALLKPGISIHAAKTSTDETARRMALSRPDVYRNGADFTTIVTPLRDELVGDFKTPIWVLFGAVGLLLLITCSNVASLLMARASVRTREIALRASLGAGKWRIVRQLLTESGLLAALGGLAGCGLAAAALRLVPAALPAYLTGRSQIRMDAGVLLFSLVSTAAAGLLFGLAPAVRASRSDLQSLLKASSANIASRSRLRVNNLLVVMQFGLSVVLLIGAGLLLRSFRNVISVDPGFRTDNILTFQIVPQAPKYQEADVRRFYHELLRRIRETPGVRQAGAASILPFDGRDWQDGYEIVPGETTLQGPKKVIDFRTATPGYFEAMGFHLLWGRTFQETDRANSPRVAIVDEELARRHWSGSSALGKRIKFSDSWLEIVGVVASVHHWNFDVEASGQLYIPAEQSKDPYVSIAVETNADPATLMAPMRAIADGMDPDVPVFEMHTMKELASVALGRRRFTMWLLGFFAVLAMGLSAVGLYGVIAQSVSARINEIGIRVALGARPGEILRMILGSGLALVAMGATLGCCGALTLSRVLASQLFGVKNYDPATFLTVTAVLAAVAVAAACIPAIKALRIDPLAALRYD